MVTLTKKEFEVLSTFLAHVRGIDFREPKDLQDISSRFTNDTLEAVKAACQKIIEAIEKAQG